MAQICSCKVCCQARDFCDVYILCHRRLSRQGVQYISSPLLVGKRYVQRLIDPSRSQYCWIQDVRPVTRCDYVHLFSVLESIKLS